MNGIISLFKFSTRLPIGGKNNFDMEEMGKSMKYFPLVGIILGLIMYSFVKILSLYINSSLLIAVLILMIYVILTGGIHLDGLSDTFDGIFSYRSKQRMLEIMKDSRVGANGVMSLVLYFLLGTILIAEVETLEVPMGAVILLFPVIGRMNSVLNCAVSEYARSSGMAKAFVENTGFKDFVVALLITLIYTYGVIVYFALSISIIAVPLLMALLGYYFAKVMKKKIGGVTGDTLGAILELTQLATVLSVYFLA